MYTRIAGFHESEESAAFGGFKPSWIEMLPEMERKEKRKEREKEQEERKRERENRNWWVKKSTRRRFSSNEKPRPGGEERKVVC